MPSLYACLLWPLLLPAPLTAWGNGVLVERVGAGYAFDKAGIEPGDLLLDWRVMEAEGGRTHSGRFNSPFDVSRVGTEYAPRGHTTVTLRRAGQESTLEIPDGLWVGGEFFAASASQHIESYRAALEELAAGRQEEGAAILRTLIDSATGTSDHLAEAWYRYKLASALLAAGRFQEAAEMTETAVAVAESSGHSHAAGWIMQQTAIDLLGKGRAREASSQLERVLALREARHPRSLSVAQTLHNLVVVSNIRSDFAAAREYGARALEILDRLAPGTLTAAETLHYLGNAAFFSDDLETAETYYRQAFEIRRRFDPGGITEARSLQVLANVYWASGRLAEAQAHYQQALDVYRAVLPQDYRVGEALFSLGFVALDRGKLAKAEIYYLRALENLRVSNPPGTQVAVTLWGLGRVAHARGSLEAAEGYYRRALEESERVQPGGQRVALLLYDLGKLARERGDLDAAEQRFSESLAIVETLGGAGPMRGWRLHALGQVSLARGDYPLAAARFEQARALFAAREPSNLQVAEVLRSLGRLAERRGHIDEAAARVRAALTMARARAPGTVHVAEPAHYLGALSERAGEQREALEYYRQAIDALESQRTLLGGSYSGRASFEERYGRYYKDYIRLLLGLGEPEAAFEGLERYRARALLALLGGRDLDLARDLPPDVAAHLERARWAYEQALAKLMAPDGAADAASLSAELGRRRSELTQAAEAARLAGPAAAGAQDPQPIGLPEVAAALDEETALLSYLVLEGAVKLFLLGAGDANGHLQVVDIPVDAAELSERVHRFRLLVQTPTAGADTRRALDALARELYALLIEPAESALGRAERLLIVPDGPLHLLPFAALARDSDDGGLHYVVEDWAVAITLSASLYDVLSQRLPGAQEERTAMSLAAIGAPLAGAEVTAASGALRPAVASLPHALQEIEAIAELYPDAIVLTGASATEERVRALTSDADIVHFAAHAIADHRFPMESYLVLNRPPRIEAGQDNGLLQAREILGKLHLDADLVVLSACDTALGREMGGEGLMGLTRAFHYAGARSVVASLWAVSDRSTAELMIELHRNLRDGLPIDEALRRAQLSLLRPGEDSALGWIRAAFDRERGDFSHPYHWASFELHGAVNRAR